MSHIADGRVVEILAPHSAPGPPVQALCRPRRQRIPTICALRDFLVETFAR